MEFFERLREKIALHLLKDKYKTVSDKRFVPLDAARSIVILYDASLPENDLAVKRIRDLIKLSNPTPVRVVGYHPYSHPQREYMSDALNSFVERKDFSFFYQPKTETIKTLLTNQNDLMMVLATKPVFALQILTRFMPALCKAGRNNLFDNDVDFLIDLPNESSIEKVGEAIVAHLGMIKSK